MIENTEQRANASAWGGFFDPADLGERYAPERDARGRFVKADSEAAV